MIFAGAPKEGRQENLIRPEKCEQYPAGRGCSNYLYFFSIVVGAVVPPGIKRSSSAASAEKFAVAAELRG